ncbi:protein PROCA1-like [Echinops telfairi]|uniref:Protein PROCA1-like n=1 Tax=Echinops telfairi TaxID=9371 RepID=A0ABM0IRU1_ECHTE|nr:protein PROCA1-like [Echinops telfairi]
MWVRTTLRLERWTGEVPGRETDDWEASQSGDINRSPNWERRHLDSGGSSTEGSTCSSEADLQENDRCHWNHTQCARHILHPLVSDYGHHQLHLHAVSHCDCDSRGKDCSEKANSGGSSSQDVGPACFKIIQTPCYELFPEEECVERFWYRKNQGSKVTKKVKKKKEKEKEKEESSSDREKTKLKKKATKGKVTKKKSPLKSEPSPPDSARSASPRELTVMSESSPESREDLESEESNSEPRQERPCSEESAPASSPRKREKRSPTKKPARKLSPAKKVTKKNSPPTSNPNLS